MGETKKNIIEAILDQIQTYGLSTDAGAITNKDLARHLQNNNVVARQHGTWIDVRCDNGQIVHKCSVCGHEIRNVPPFPNCPYCIAIMDGSYKEQMNVCQNCHKKSWCNHIGDPERCTNNHTDTADDPIKKGMPVWCITEKPLTVRRGDILCADRAKNSIVIYLYDEVLPLMRTYDSIDTTVFIGSNSRDRAMDEMRRIRALKKL